MGKWGISENATPKQKLKSEYADLLNGMNSVGHIDYSAYSNLFDFGMELLDRMYELGKKENTTNIQNVTVFDNRH